MITGSNKPNVISLGIETSCDETSVAIVNSNREILSHEIYSQNDHCAYGGVVPEIAARSHIIHLKPMVQKTIESSGISLSDIDIFSATFGPGLIGGVIVGAMMSKALALVTNKPLITVNHLAGHALTVRLVDENVQFPFLLLLISGGHCQITIVHNAIQYENVGSTIDDALGEAYDKIAKMLGLGYPGGVMVEKYAKDGNCDAFKFPHPLCNQDNCDFSFSGLKTAVRYTIESLTAPLSKQQISDICASFQKTVGNILKKKLSKAIDFVANKYSITTVVIAGGVAANEYVRDILTQTVEGKGYNLSIPPKHLCTDNAAMIAWAGLEIFFARKCVGNALDTGPMSVWPLHKFGTEQINE